MPDYRCYFFDADQKVGRAEVQEFGGDAAALAWAHERRQAFPHYRATEVWTGSRLVERYQPGRVEIGSSARDAAPPEDVAISSAVHDTPDHWRRQAADTRAAAEQMSDPNARATLLRIAERYESLARHGG